MKRLIRVPRCWNYGVYHRDSGLVQNVKETSMIFYRIKKSIFLKNSILYTLGSMMTPLIGFIMLPIYTNYLSPSEYGIMTTVQTVVGLLQVILVLSLHGAVTRFFYDFLNDTEKPKEYLGTIYLFVFIFSTIISFLLLIFRGSIGILIFNNIPLDPYYYYLLGLAWLSSLLSLPMALLRAQEKAGTFLMINLSKSIFIVVLTIFFLIYKGLGAESALLSQLIVSFIVVVIVLYTQIKYLKFSLNLKFIRESLLFSLPLLPHVASGWIITSSDRIILEKFVSTAELGIYAIAAQISMVLGMVYMSINGALVPRYTRLRKEGNEQAAKILHRNFFYIVIFFGILALPVAIYVTKLLVSTEYQEAINIMPFLIIGHIIQGLYFIPGLKLMYAKKMKSIAISSLLAALVNIVINIIYIPVIGIFAAVLSTIIAESVRVTLIFIASRKA